MEADATVEMLGQVIGDHLKTNGIKTQKYLWLRFAIELIVITILATTAWVKLRSDINANCKEIKTNTENITKEVVRSATVDKQRDIEMVDIRLKLTTVDVRQEAIINNQLQMGKNIDKIDTKLDRVLDHLPK